MGQRPRNENVDCKRAVLRQSLGVVDHSGHNKTGVVARVVLLVLRGVAHNGKGGQIVLRRRGQDRHGRCGGVEGRGLIKERCRDRRAERTVQIGVCQRAVHGVVEWQKGHGSINDKGEEGLFLTKRVMLKYWFGTHRETVNDDTIVKSGSVLAMRQEDDFVDVGVRELSFAEAAALPAGTKVVDEWQLGRSVTDGEMADAWKRATQSERAR